jgi:hypothetical protein
MNFKLLLPVAGLMAASVNLFAAGSNTEARSALFSADFARAEALLASQSSTAEVQLLSSLVDIGQWIEQDLSDFAAIIGADADLAADYTDLSSYFDADSNAPEVQPIYGSSEPLTMEESNGMLTFDFPAEDSGVLQLQNTSEISQTVQFSVVFGDNEDWAELTFYKNNEWIGSASNYGLSTLHNWQEWESLTLDKDFSLTLKPGDRLRFVKGSEDSQPINLSFASQSEIEVQNGNYWRYDWVSEPAFDLLDFELIESSGDAWRQDVETTSNDSSQEFSQTLDYWLSANDLVQYLGGGSRLLNLNFQGGSGRQVDLEFFINQVSDGIYDYYYDFPVDGVLYLNGVEIGSLNSWGFDLDAFDVEEWIWGSSNSSDPRYVLSLWMEPGDQLTLELDADTYYYGIAEFSDSTVPVVGLNLVDPVDLQVSNGQGYKNVYPKLTAGTTSDLFSQFLFGQFAGAGGELVSQLISRLSNLEGEFSVVFEPEETGFAERIRVEYEDVQILLAFLKYLSGLQLVFDTYSLGEVDLGYSTYLSYLDDPFALWEDHPQLLALIQSRSAQAAQAKSLFQQAVNHYNSVESALWSRVSGATDSYLFEVDGATEAERAEFSDNLALFVRLINESVALSELKEQFAASEIDYNFDSDQSVSLQPLLAPSPADIRGILPEFSEAGIVAASSGSLLGSGLISGVNNLEFDQLLSDAGVLVWELYDDFSGSALNTDKWETWYMPGGQVPVVSGGQLRLENGAGSGRKDPAFMSTLQSAGIDFSSLTDHSGLVFTDPSIIGIEAELLLPVGVASDSGVFIELFEQVSDQEIRSAGVELGYWEGESQPELWFHKNAYSSGTETNEVDHTEYVALGHSYRVRMLRQDGLIQLYMNDALMQTHAAEGELLALFIAAFNDSGQPMYATIDNVRVLRYTTSGSSLPVVESYGNTDLLEGEDGYYADSAETPLLYGGTQVSSSTYPGFSALGVDLVDGAYRLVRSNGSQYYVANFATDGHSSSSWVLVSDVLAEEVKLQQDLDGDGYVGTAPVSPPASLDGKAYQFSIGGDYALTIPLEVVYGSATYDNGFAGSLINVNKAYTYANGIVTIDGGHELRLTFTSSDSGTFQMWFLEDGTFELYETGTFSEVTPSLVQKSDWQRRETLNKALSKNYWNVWRRSVDSLRYSDGELNFLFADGGDPAKGDYPEFELEYGRTLPMDEDWRVVLDDIHVSDSVEQFDVELDLEVAGIDFECDLAFNDYGYGREVFLSIENGEGYGYAWVSAEQAGISNNLNMRITHVSSSRELVFEYQPDGAIGWSELARLNLGNGAFSGTNSSDSELSGELVSASQRMTLEVDVEANQATQVGDLEIGGIEVAEIEKSTLKVQVSLAKGIVITDEHSNEATVVINDTPYTLTLERGKGTLPVVLHRGPEYTVSASMGELTSGTATSVTLTKSKKLKLVLDGDSDGDGLSDSQEARYKGKPNNADTDGDGIPDGDEVYTYRTRVNSPDTDKDGLSDYEEINTYSTNPLKADSDGDRMSDSAEIEAGTDPLDKSEYPAYLKVQVSLAKGISGDGEATVLIDDVSYPVSLVRGKGTVQVALPTGVTYTVSASMGELTSGTATSVTLAKSKTLKLVLDGDSDGDGLSDSKEARYKGDPNNADTDGDGISDGEEVEGKTKVNVADSDNDGFTDKQELDLGTDPLSSKEKPDAYIERSVRTDWELTYDAEDGYIKETWSGDEFALLLGSARGAETDSATLHLKYSLDGSNVRWIVRDGVQDLDVTTLMRRLKVSKPGKLDAAVMSPIDESSGAYYGAEMFTLSVNLGGGKSLSLVVSGESAFSPVGENESGLDFDLAESADYTVLGVLQDAKLSEGPILIEGTLTMGDEVANVQGELISEVN